MVNSFWRGRDYVIKWCNGRNYRCVYLPAPFSFPSGKTALYLGVSQIQRYSILT